MMSLPAMSLGDRFCGNRKGWTEGGGWVHLKGENAWLCLGSARERPRLVFGGPFVSSYA